MAEESMTPEIRFKGFTDPWEQRKLGELASEFASGDFIAADKIEPTGKYPVYGGNGLRGFTDHYNHDGFYALIGRQGALCGNVNSADGKAYFTEHAVAVQANRDNDTQFLVHLLGGMNLGQYSGQSAQPGLAVGVLLEVETMVPAKAEQHATGQLLSGLDSLITLHQRKYDKLIQTKKAMLNKMFPKPGESVPEIRFKGFTDPWEQRKLSDIADRYNNLRVPVAANLRISGNTPYYGANGIQDYVDGYTHDGEFVLVAEDGANDLKNYPVRYVKGRIWVNNHAHVLQGKANITDNRFLSYGLGHADIESLLVGGGRAKLNAETMMGIEVNLPTYNEQTAIGACFRDLDTLITLHQRKLELLKNVKKAMLDKMFV